MVYSLLKPARPIPVLSSATDNAIALFDGTGGRTLKESNILCTDGGVVSTCNSWGNSVCSNHVTTVSVTTAQLLGMFAIPVQIVGAPGSGWSIVVHRAFLQQNFNSIAFILGGSPTLQYGNTAAGLGSSALSADFSVSVMRASSTTGQERMGQMTTYSGTVYENEAVYLSNKTLALSLGNGSAKVTVEYSVLAV